MAGVVWVGHVATLQLRLENAAREGARAAAVEPDAATAAAVSAAQRSVSDAAVSVSLGAEYVEVTVRADVAGVPIIGVGERTLEADVTMRREDLP